MKRIAVSLFMIVAVALAVVLGLALSARAWPMQQPDAGSIIAANTLEVHPAPLESSQGLAPMSQRVGVAMVTATATPTPTGTPVPTFTATDTATPATTPTPGFDLRGHVLLSDGTGLPGVDIHLYLAYYSQYEQVVATTNAEGYYQAAYMNIPGQEHVTFYPTLAGYSFDPESYHWFHQGGVEHVVHDFVAYPLTPTPTNTPTETPTPTSERPPPLPPLLISPADGALLPQPVPPGEWVFECGYAGGASVSYHTLVITGPGAHQIIRDFYTHGAWTYVYTSTEYIPDDALGPWYWRVIAYGLGAYPESTSSETRTFWVMTASTSTPTPTDTLTNTPTGTPTQTPTPTVTRTMTRSATPPGRKLCLPLMIKWGSPQGLTGPWAPTAPRPAAARRHYAN